MSLSAKQWSEEEFGGADLGDKRLVDRLKLVGAQAALRPGGQVTAVFSEQASREGAFRLVNNESVSAEKIAMSAHRACAKRSRGQEFVFVAVDGSSLNFTDTRRSKGLGVVGSRKVGAQGLKVISALGVSPEGVPLGLCGQKYWGRTKRSSGDRKHDTRKTEDKETQHWLDVMTGVRAVFRAEAPSTRPWFQIDREGDSWPLLRTALDADQLLTIRSNHDRCLEGPGGEKLRLRHEVERQPVLGCYSVEIAERPERRNSRQRTAKARAARVALMDVRACPVTLSLLDMHSGKRHLVSLWAVLATEQKTDASTADLIDWLLLTTKPVASFEEAAQVLFGYTQRWRIEEFHKAWKSGACRAEDTQLRDRSHIIRWMVILASVAARILRMTYLARESPTSPATTAFSLAEIEAIFLGSPKTRHRRGQLPSIAEAVDLLARIGGYIG